VKRVLVFFWGKRCLRRHGGKKKSRVQSLLQQIDRQARTVNLIPHMRCVPSSQSNVHQNRFLRHHRSRHGRCDNGLSVAGRRRFAPASCPLDGDRNMAKTIRITDWFMRRVFFFFPFSFRWPRTRTRTRTRLPLTFDGSVSSRRGEPGTTLRGCWSPARCLPRPARTAPHG